MAATPLRDVPDDVMQHYTDVARREGISRNAVLVRVLTHAARVEARGPLTREMMLESAHRARDLTDPEVMRGAWS